MPVSSPRDRFPICWPVRPHRRSPAPKVRRKHSLCFWSRPNSCADRMIDRRTCVGAGAAGAALLAEAPHLAVAQAGTDRRFVVVIQRGAADGLATLAPTGDTDFARARGAFAEVAARGTRLGSFFNLHPDLAETGRLYAAGEALFAH